MLYLSLGITIYCCLVVTLFGACMGSFLNCAAWRIVHGESISRGRSHCDECGHVLGFKDLVPIAGFLASKGRCRYCGVKLSPVHLWAELITALSFVALLLKYDLTLSLLMWLCFASIVLCCAFADIEAYIIPDRLIILGLVCRIAAYFMLGEGLPQALDAVYGGILVPGLLLLVVLAFEKLKKVEAMGGGDIKLLAVCGLFLGWKANILCIFIACVLGIVFALATKGRRGTQENTAIFPWGPSIALAAIFCAIWGNELIALYLRSFI